MDNHYSSSNWSQLYKFRREISCDYPDPMKIQIVKRPQALLKSYIHSRRTVLEIGAGQRKLKDQLTQLYGEIQYKSFDIDQTNYHDYYDLEKIEGKFQLVCMFEVIEHLSIENAYRTLSRCHKLLESNGLMLITTPNIYYPPAFLRDITHITPWAYDELAGFGKLIGFEVIDIFRLYHDAWHRKIVRRFILHPVHKMLGIDYAKQIAVLFRKP